MGPIAKIKSCWAPKKTSSSSNGSKDRRTGGYTESGSSGSSSSGTTSSDTTSYGSGSGSGSGSSSSSGQADKKGHDRPMTFRKQGRLISRPLGARVRRPCYDSRRPVPTPFDDCLQKVCKQRMSPFYSPNPRPLPDNNCDAARKLRVYKAELERLRQDKWRQDERAAILGEKKHQEWMEEQYYRQAEQWEISHEESMRHREVKQNLIRQIMLQREEIRKLREESKAWHRKKLQLMQEKHLADRELWVKELCEREEERRLHREQIQVQQEDKFLHAQTQHHNTNAMVMPELEELRRMFVPVNKGLNETFEYVLVEPRPTPAELRQSAEMKMAALLGLRNEHGIHLDCSDRCKKNTTITVAMGPKSLKGESCKVINTPGASCRMPDLDKSCSKMPNVHVPECLQPLMKTLSYRLEQANSPLLRMKSFGPSPHFNGSRLYGTIVLPKGKNISPLYTNDFSVTC